MVYTLHKDVGDEGGFDFDLPEATQTVDPTYHAENASNEADSASCGLDGFSLPDIFRVLADGTLLAGWDEHKDCYEPRAAKATEGRVVMSGEVFEVDVDDSGEVVKVCARVPYTEAHDMCLVADPQDGTLITAWVNRADDRHDSLDASNYDRVEQTPLA